MRTKLDSREIRVVNAALNSQWLVTAPIGANGGPSWSSIT
jgi:hypothetical protein